MSGGGISTMGSIQAAPGATGDKSTTPVGGVFSQMGTSKYQPSSNYQPVSYSPLNYIMQYGAARNAMSSPAFRPQQYAPANNLATSAYQNQMASPRQADTSYQPGAIGAGSQGSIPQSSFPVAMGGK